MTKRQQNLAIPIVIKRKQISYPSLFAEMTNKLAFKTGHKSLNYCKKKIERYVREGLKLETDLS